MILLIHIIVFLSFSILFTIKIKDLYCLDKNLCFKNLSSSKLLKPYLCSENNRYYLNYHPNRKWTVNPSYIICTIYFYPSFRNLYDYLLFVKKFSQKNNGEKLLLISVNISLYSILQSIEYMKEIKYRSSIYEYLTKLDKGYKIFKYKYNKSFCYLIYTNIDQNYFDYSFLNQIHRTRNKVMFPFSGYYAAGTNLYAVIPYMLKIFDYYDFFFKYDFDAKHKYIVNIRNYAFSNISFIKWYLIGIPVGLDSPFVCNNVKNMIIEYLKMKKCNKPITDYINYTVNNNLHIPGYLTGVWLGLYSSIEMKEFSNYYITYENGIKLYRWSEQQFYVNSLLLFGEIKNLYYNKVQ